MPSSRRREHQHHPKAHQSRTPQEWSRWPCPSTVNVSPSTVTVPRHEARDLVAGRQVVVIRDAVGRPRDVQVELRGGAGLLAVGVDVLGRGDDAGRGVSGQAELLERPAEFDFDSFAVFALADETVLRGDRHLVVGGADAGAVGPDDPGRPPGHLAVGVEAEPEPTPHGAVGADEVAVIGLVPQVLAIGVVPGFVVWQDDVVRRHSPGPGCMAEAPIGPGTSTMGSSRSSNSVRKAFDMTACWK